MYSLAQNAVCRCSYKKKRHEDFQWVNSYTSYQYCQFEEGKLIYSALLKVNCCLVYNLGVDHMGKDQFGSRQTSCRPNSYKPFELPFLPLRHSMKLGQVMSIESLLFINTNKPESIYFIQILSSACNYNKGNLN